MAPLKKKGDLAELKVACDLMDRGVGDRRSWGENCDFDLMRTRYRPGARSGQVHRIGWRHRQREMLVLLANQRKGQAQKALHRPDH